MRRTADLRGRHDLGEIVGYSYLIYARHFVALFSIALTTVPVHMLFVVLQRRVDPNSGAYGVVSLLVIPDLLIVVVAAGAVIQTVNDVANGVPPESGRSLDAAFSRFGALVSTLALAAVLTVASLIAFPYFAVRWTLSQQGVMIGGKRNWAALDASSSIVKGQWWRTFGIILVVTLIALGPTLIAQTATLGPAIIDGLVTSVVSAFVMPFVLTAQTLLYYDLRARKQVDAGTDRLSPPEQDLSR